MLQASRYLILTGIIAVCVLVACASPTQSTPVVPRSARISEIINLVETRTSAGATFATATLNQALAVNQQVRTGVQSKARIDFSEGSIVRLSENTLLTVEDTQGSDAGARARFQLELGKIWVSVFGGMFELQTPVGIATVRGSYAVFEVVRANPDDPNSITLVMDCLEGSCTAKNENVAMNFGNLERVVIPKGARTANRTAAPANALPDFLKNNPEPASQHILPTLTAAPPLTKERPLLPSAEPFVTATPRARPTDAPIALPSRTLQPPPTRTPEPSPTRLSTSTPILPAIMRPSATPEARITLARPSDPIIAPTPEPSSRINPTVPSIIVRPTDAIIVRPTDPIISILPTRPSIIVNPTLAIPTVGLPIIR